MPTDRGLLQSDVAARSRALDVSQSFIVQAPAGSGKTGLLIQRYLALLPTVDHPEQVLAITFTRKAAAEMQYRVIEALRNARDKKKPESEHELLTHALAERALRHASDKGWDLIASSNRLRIETVDAFAASIARFSPLSSELGGTVGTASDAEVPGLYQRAAATTLNYLAGSDAAAGTVEVVLQHLDNNSRLFIAYLSRMLASREQWLGITGSGKMSAATAVAVRASLESNIAKIVQRHLQMTDALIPDFCRSALPVMLDQAAQSLVDSDVTDHALLRRASPGLWPAADPDARHDWRAIRDCLLTKEGNWRKTINKNDGFPPKEQARKKAFMVLLEGLRECTALRIALNHINTLPETRYSDEQWRVLLALFELLPLAVVELRKIFAEQGVTDHNEVALAADRALGSSDQPGEVALMLDYRLQHLLVDEMQDTSIAQYELLKKVIAGWSGDDGRTIFCVGDPMQSIYRFRDAEVGEFLQARSNGIGSVPLEPLLLRRNFRSGKHLVDWFNMVFSQILPLQDNLAIGAIAYAESLPADSTPYDGQCKIHPLFACSPEEEAQYALCVIRDCLQESVDGDVAVLVRSRTQLTELMPLLRRSGIEYQAVEIERLTDLPEIADLLALTRSLSHDGDRLAWLSVLRGPWVGLTWIDLHALVLNDAVRPVIELLRDPARLSNLSEDAQRRVQRFLRSIETQRLASGTSSLRDRCEQAWFELGGPALLKAPEEMENITRYFTALDSLDAGGSLHDIAELEAKLDDERISTAVSAACRVHIMTMHKAKGLQFDHVVLPGLGRKTRGNEKSVMSWLTVPVENAMGEMLISPVGARADTDNDLLHQYIEKTEQEKSRLELDRLLYVACTRAKQSLHLVGNVGLSADQSKCLPPSSQSLLRRLWPAIAPHFNDAFASREPAVEPAVDVEPAQAAQYYMANPALRRFATPFEAPAVVPLAPASYTSARRAVTEVEFSWVGTAARHAGTLVHRWLHRFALKPGDVSQTALPSLRGTTAAWARSSGVLAADIEAVCERTELALTGILGDEKGRWILEGEGAAELALTGEFEGELASVLIDRVRIGDDGTHWIIDYKTSTHEGGNLDNFLQQEALRYRAQLAKYAHLYKHLSDATIRTALYFPLLQKFVEVNTAETQLP